MTMKPLQGIQVCRAGTVRHEHELKAIQALEEAGAAFVSAPDRTVAMLLVMDNVNPSERSRKLTMAATIGIPMVDPRQVVKWLIDGKLCGKEMLQLGRKTSRHVAKLHDLPIVNPVKLVDLATPRSRTQVGGLSSGIRRQLDALMSGQVGYRLGF